MLIMLTIYDLWTRSGQEYQQKWNFSIDFCVLFSGSASRGKKKGAPMVEEEAVRRCQSGDREAFKYVVEQYKHVLYGTAYLMTGDKAVAEDQVQETFLSAWKGIGGCRNKCSLKHWLIKILVNKVLSYRRSGVNSISVLGHSEPVDKVEDTAEEVERNDQIERALNQLSYEHRQVILLRYFTGLSLAEIATTLNSPEGTIKSQLHRATERLRCYLNDGNAAQG
jgi:RNA polymerase sigma-70 factor (ECF subfamily)